LRRGCAFLALTLILASLAPHGYSVTTFYGGAVDRPDYWRRLLDTDTAYFWSQGDFFHYPWEGENLMALEAEGMKINYRLYWWHSFFNGEIAWNTSVVDLYYNATLMRLLEEHIDTQLSHLDMGRVWAVTLSEEEPQGSFAHFWSPRSLERYNETFHRETGYWLRAGYTMNESEAVMVNRWLGEKTLSVFNHIHDYVKTRWPHVVVFQFMGLAPGAPAVYGGGLDLTDLKADAIMADLYYYDVYLNPFWLYEYVRHAKTTFMDKEYHIWLWGEEPWPEGGLAGGLEHIRRNAWIAYLAGADGVGWFNWHYVHGQLWERDDPLGKKTYLYTNRLNAEFSKLPVFKPRPQVLIIREDPVCFQLGLGVDTGMFNEWDTVNQRTLAKTDFDLSRYKLVVASEETYMDEVVDKLNGYVWSGGNLVLLGGFGWEQMNIHYNATRTSRFLMEEVVTQSHVWGDIDIDVSGPNPLGLDLHIRGRGTSLQVLDRGSLTASHHPIGEFTLKEGGVETPVNGCPLVLYHDAEIPGMGSILYWGVRASNADHDGVNADVVESFIDELNHTRYLYRAVARAYASNYLHMLGSVTKPGFENMIVTQAEIGDGVVMAGVSNYYDHAVKYNYTLELGRFQLAEGGYWVHSLDEDAAMGRFVSQGGILEVPLSVDPQGTKLLLISQEKPEPSYRVDVFPDVPSDDEVERLWERWDAGQAPETEPVKENEEQPVNETEAETETPPTPEPLKGGRAPYEAVIALIGALVIGFLLLRSRK